MHELSIAHSLVEAVCEALASPTEGGVPDVEFREAARARVREVRIAVGALSGVVPDALRFCYDIATADTPLAGSTLVIDAVPIAVWCTPCGAERVLADGARFRCPVCDVPTGDIRRGRELDLVSYTLDDASVDASVDASHLPQEVA
jgi:hydrogenase nickel incorporation protein HypA/HybF